MRKPQLNNPQTMKRRTYQRKCTALLFALITLFTCSLTAFASTGASDPLTSINNLSTFIFAAIKAIGAIMLGFGIVQVGLSLKGHDPGQRANGFMTCFGGIVIFFAKEILDMIT